LGKIKSYIPKHIRSPPASAVRAGDAGDVVASPSKFLGQIWSKFRQIWENLCKIWANLDKVCVNLGEIWEKMVKIWAI